MSELRPFPKYMNHVDHNEPVRVDSKAEQVDMQNKGWTTARIFKEYPKWVGDKLVRSKAEEARLFGSQSRAVDPADVVNAVDPMPVDIPDLSEASTPKEFKTKKELQAGGQDTATVGKPKKSAGRPKNS